MDWSLYPNLYYYVKKFPQTKAKEVEEDSTQQCVSYPEKKNPVKKVDRLFLPFQKITTEASTQSNNESLWKILCKYIDKDHIITTKSYQNENLSYLIRSLKEFVVKPDIRSILTSRRMYPILEMLDKPYVEFTRQHQNAIGFFFAYLLEYKIKIDNDNYTYLPESVNILTITRNSKGYWFEQETQQIKIDTY
jgi:hypothetical protein